jgi:predicted house-cleaning noncanonical NTP pyrophosphatase (MazG superfamily)
MTFRPKLVRDRIPEVIRKNGTPCEFVVMDDAEYRKRLCDKMREELEEFSLDPSVEEAADMYEVFLAMLEEWGLSLADVLQEADWKRNERGGFGEKILLKKIGNECNL